MPLFEDDPKLWRLRAEEARVVAGKMKDATAAQMILQVAENYEQLARHAERRIAREREEQP